MTTTAEKPFVGYGRNSRLGARERGNNNSIHDQRRAIETIARMNDLTLLPEIIEDEDVSGATFDRPGWKRAVALVESGEAAGIIAPDLDRISRGTTGDTLRILDEIESLGGQVYDRSGRISVEDVDDELLTTVKAMLARSEWRKRKDYLDSSVKRAIEENGVHLGIPFGYERSAGKGSKLAIVPHEAEIIRFAFAERAAGKSWQAIANALNAGDVPPRPYKRNGVERQGRWTHKTVLQMVGREVYTGVAHAGSRRNVDAHPAIVDRDLFERANRTKGTKHAKPSEGYLLSGLVRCASCGYALVHSVGPGTRRYYRCKPNQHGAGPCKAPVNVEATHLESWAVEQLRPYLDVEFEAVADDSEVVEATERFNSAKSRVSAIFERFASLEVSATEQEIVDAQMSRARAELADAEADLEAARHRARGLDLPKGLDLDGFDSLPVSERRHLLGLVFACFVVRRAQAYRESVEKRAVPVLREDAPTDSLGLIGFVSARNW